MALGTDVSELKEVPGTAALAGNLQLPIKIPGTGRGVLHRVSVARLLAGLGVGGPDYTALELAPDRHLFADEELTSIQQALDDGTLVWIYDDGSGLRQQVTAGTSPIQTPAQNSAALISMAAGLPQP